MWCFKRNETGETRTRLEATGASGGGPVGGGSRSGWFGSAKEQEQPLFLAGDFRTSFVRVPAQCFRLAWNRKPALAPLPRLVHDTANSFRAALSQSSYTTCLQTETDMIASVGRVLHGKAKARLGHGFTSGRGEVALSLRFTTNRRRLHQFGTATLVPPRSIDKTAIACSRHVYLI